MDSGSAGLDRLTAEGARDWDRFAGWRRGPARALLCALAALLALAVTIPLIDAGQLEAAVPASGATAVLAPEITDGTRPRDDDLALYDRAIERIAAGENYYDFIVEEQRLGRYPLRPAITVRLPTLAYIQAWAGPLGMVFASVLLIAATLWAWWRRLGEEQGDPRVQRFGAAFLLFGSTLLLNSYYHVLHEMWAGMLLTLAFGLHRPSRWGAALGVAALALAIREHVLPFVLLLGAMALWRRDWKEMFAWGALVAAFLAYMAWHIAQIEPQLVAGDVASPGWMSLRGLEGWLDNIVQSSNLRFLPLWLAGPVVLLMILGWAGWKSPAGLTGTLLFLGYGLAFMIAGRENNFYWGAIIAPPMFIGLAFLPMALSSLLRRASAA